MAKKVTEEQKRTEMFLEQLGRLPQGATLAIKGSVNNDKRKGNYLVVKSGLLVSTYFVGKTEKDQIVAEFVGP